MPTAESSPNPGPRAGVFRLGVAVIDAVQLTQYVIAPALQAVGLDSPEARQLVLATAAVESRCGRYLHQVGGGPARGIWQCEPATHDDLWRNFLNAPSRKGVVTALRRLAPAVWDTQNAAVPVSAEALTSSLLYAAAICRLHYRRFPEPLPGVNDWRGMGSLWLRRYNAGGKGTLDVFMDALRECKVIA